MRISILLTFLFCSLQAFAAPIRFPDHNFSIEIPTTWVAISPLPPQTIVAVQSPDAAKKLLVSAARLSPRDRSSGARRMRAGAKESMTARGWQIDPERQLTIGDLPFVSFTAHIPTGATLTAYSAAAEDEVYMLQSIILRASDAASDPELQSAVQSFTLLSPALSQSNSSPTSSTAYRVGQIFGRLFVYVFLPIAIITLIRRARAKR
jgi:hypothetical protein